MHSYKLTDIVLTVAYEIAVFHLNGPCRSNDSTRLVQGSNEFDQPIWFDQTVIIRKSNDVVAGIFHSNVMGIGNSSVLPRNGNIFDTVHGLRVICFLHDNDLEHFAGILKIL
jgi:hypothetical protein